MKKLLRIALGVILLIIGLIGLMIPIMPQWPFIIPGLIILADYFSFARRILDWLKRKLGGTRFEKYLPK